MKSEKVTADLPDGLKWCVSCCKSASKYIEIAPKVMQFRNMIENPTKKYFQQNPFKIPRNNTLTIMVAKFKVPTPSELEEI